MFALTSRLTLRPGWPEDAPALADAIGHEAVCRNLARAPWPYGVDDAAAFLSLPRAADQPRFQIIERSGSHAMIGGVELVSSEGQPPELGYWLTPSAWGRGYATEAGRAVVEMARALRMEQLAAKHFVDNPASGRVLRKLGFQPTGASRLFSIARGIEAECIDMVLTLTDDEAEPARPDMPIAA